MPPSAVAGRYFSSLLVGERLLGVRSKGSERCAVGRMFVRHSVDVVGDFADFAAMSTSGERLIGSGEG